MNLCHCSKSCCTSCTLRSGECNCASSGGRPRTATLSACQRCAEFERLLKKASDQVFTLQKELADARGELAASSHAAQQDREARAVLVGHARTLEGQIAALSQQRQRVQRDEEGSDEEVKQLRQQLGAALEARAALEKGRRTALLQVSKTKEELAEVRLRLQGAEQTARIAEEGRLEYIADLQVAAEKEKTMRAELAAAQAERDVLRHEAQQLEKLRERVAQETAARKVAEDKLKASKPVVVEKENGRYEELRVENRKLQALLAEAQDMCRQSQGRAEMVEKLESRVEVLTQEKMRLGQEAAHAKHVRELFASVTSRTNEVQESAQSVIQAVEASKRARNTVKISAEGRAALSENLPEQQPRQPGRTRAGPRTPRTAPSR